jgi:hypothetical protein
VEQYGNLETCTIPHVFGSDRFDVLFIANNTRTTDK